MTKPGAPARQPIVVGMSGGINSAVAAALLKSQGYSVHGVYLNVCDPKAPPARRFNSRCCLTKSEAAAREVCRKLEIAFHAVDAVDLFEDKVIDPFVHDLLQCRFPNPCIPCNLDVRFSRLFREADRLGCEQVATGHHAQILRDAVGTGGDTSARLYRAVNARKDQTYFLFGLTQQQLSRLLFPLGGFQDLMIQRLAREFELGEPRAESPQQVCCSTTESYLAFFESRVPPPLRPGGNIKLADGTVMGDHRGLHAFRIGQGKVKLAPHIKDPERFLVTSFDVVGRSLVIGMEKDLYQAELRASGATWVRPIDGLHGLKTAARFTPGQAEASPCRVTHFENGIIRVELEQPALGLIVGNAVVFYDGEEVVGGAYIDFVGAVPKDT